MNRVSDGAVFLSEISVANALGADWNEVAENLFSGDLRGLETQSEINDGRSVPVGRLNFEPDALPSSLAGWESRNNRLINHCLAQMMPAIEELIGKYGAQRIGVVLGTSTSGIEQSETAIKQLAIKGSWPKGFVLARQELGDPAAFVAEVAGVKGPYFCVSTACTSGAKALASAARLLRANMCDAVIAGGVDTLCGLTLNGFSVLDSIAPDRCNPFSRNRNGINIGEGGALFLVTRDEGEFRLAGYGESADAYHLSAPDPEGAGARLAIMTALDEAGIAPKDISYVNLHGTATRLNDAMEANVTHSIFGDQLACSSTKAMTGHMLGAAGSNEAAFVAMALSRGLAPPHIWDGERDAELPIIRLADELGESVADRYMMSCSYAFGGNNTALILARA